LGFALPPKVTGSSQPGSGAPGEGVENGSTAAPCARAPTSSNAAAPRAMNERRESLT